MIASETTSQVEPCHSAAPRELKFSASDDFHRAVRERVGRYFETSGLSQRDCPAMYVKSAVIAAWCVASYVLLVFCSLPWFCAVPLAISLGLSMAAVGFNIQHDGAHQAYSKLPWVNRLSAMTLDLLGGSSYAWTRKHNIIHHSFANITGHDDDINIGVLGRLSPHQRRRKIYCFQQYYLWFLYGFMPIKWQVYDDVHDYIIGKIGGQAFARPKGRELALLIGGKLVFFSLALALPLVWHPAWKVLALFMVASFVQGVALSVVFQLAHCVGEADFPLPNRETGRMDAAWAVHQVETTVDFARGNRMLSWFIGGLNFQIEHHLFPRICHAHYRALAPIVEETCREFGVHYRVHETFTAGVVSHFRWLRRMGAADNSSAVS